MTKVTAHLDKPEVTIDQDSGNVEVRRSGTLKGFGKGLRDYVMKGAKASQVDVTVNTGQLPDGHKEAGKWAVQIIVAPLDEQDDANTVADRLASIVKAELARGQADLPMGKQH